jgi:hypothetical protein
MFLNRQRKRYLEVLGNGNNANASVLVGVKHLVVWQQSILILTANQITFPSCCRLRNGRRSASDTSRAIGLRLEGRRERKRGDWHHMPGCLPKRRRQLGAEKMGHSEKVILLIVLSSTMETPKR